MRTVFHLKTWQVIFMPMSLGFLCFACGPKLTKIINKDPKIGSLMFQVWWVAKAAFLEALDPQDSDVAKLLSNVWQCQVRHLSLAHETVGEC